MAGDPLVGLKQTPRVTTWFLGLVAAYFAAQTLLRIFSATSLSLDEAEMLVVTQDFAWGYGGSQPPLYGWLMLIAFKLFGTGIPALALVKNLLLFITFVVMFQAGRIVLGSDWKAAMTSAALVTIPQIGWKAQFDLTHSVLALVMAALTFLVFLQLLRRGRAVDYLLFGLCLALGVMSKYNYAIFAAALFAGAALVPALRPRVVSPLMLLAFAVGVIVLLPHLHWIWSHPAGAFARVNKLGIARDLGIFSASGLALLAFIRTFGGCVVLAVAVFAAAAWLPPRHAAAASDSGWPEGKQLVLRVLAVSFAFALVLIVGSRSTTLRDHWFMPLVLLLPMGLLILWERRFTMPRLRALGVASAALALAAFFALAFMHFFPDVADHRTRAAAPYARVAQSIRALGFNGGYLIAETHYVGGNLKLRFPGSPVAAVEYGFLHAPVHEPKPALIVWPGGPRLPPKLRSLWEDFCADADPGLPIQPVTVDYEYSRARYSLNVMIQPRCTPRAK